MAAVKEKATGLSFPSTISPPGLAKPLEILGAGVREKRALGLVAVKVYAIAVHVDPEPAKAALASFKGTGGLAKNDSFFEALRDGDFELSFTLVFTRDVTHEQFTSGIKESLEPKLKAKGAAPEVLSSFLEGLKGLGYTTGSRIYLTVLPGNVHVAGLKAAEVPSDLSVPADLQSVAVQSSDLSTVLKDVYFGKDSVAPSLKTAVADSVPTFLG